MWMPSGVAWNVMMRRPVSGENPPDARWARQHVRPPCWLLAVLCLVLVPLCAARQVSCAAFPRPVLIGALTESWGPSPAIVGMRDGLVALGYQEERDFFLGVRFTQGDRAALPAAAQDLLDAGAHLLFTDTNSTAIAAHQVTTRIPIVFAGVEDPVGTGLVQSFARPGGNVTGIASLDTELAPKRLQLFVALLPTLKRVLFLYAAKDHDAVQAAQAYRWAARRLGITLVEKMAHTHADVLATLADVRALQIDGMVAPRCCTLNIPGAIVDAATQQGVPSMHVDRVVWMERGALAAFGTDHYRLGQQAARLVEKILRGASPATLPVEAHSRVEFTIHLRRAQDLGLTIAPEVLYQADHLVR